MFITSILLYTLFLEDSNMKNTLEKPSTIVERLIPTAKEGKTQATIHVYPHEVDECFNLSKEGFYIQFTDYNSRNKHYDVEVEWTHPTTCKGVAIELLAISQSVQNM